jgi:UDP-2,3-diacylglucosamine hydrolase
VELIFGTFEAPAAWRAIDFISDLHLSADHPATFAAWSQYMLHTSADAVFLLGDVFDAWVGDDICDEPGFEQRCSAVLAQSSTNHALAFMAGNRDFLVGETLLSACGVSRLDDPTVLNAWGHRLMLTHGDALCLGDVDYQRFRAQVRNPAWQRSFLSRPMSERQHIARGLRAGSEAVKAEQAPDAWVDVDAAAACTWLRDAGVATMIHGHTHQPGRSPLGPGFQREVLSDWDFEAPARRGDILRLTAAGLRRLSPDQARA